MMLRFILSSLAAVAFSAEAPIPVDSGAGRLSEQEGESIFQRLVLPELVKAGASEEDADCLGAATGAFTRKGAAQTAVRYLATITSHNDNPHGVAIIEDGELLGRLEFESSYGGSISSLPDIDRNGLSELVLHDGTAGQGSGVDLISLLELPGGKVRKLGFFKVHENDCGVEEGKGTRKDIRIFARPGPRPAFTQEILTGPCEGAVRPQGGASPAKPEKDESRYTFVRPKKKQNPGKASK